MQLIGWKDKFGFSIRRVADLFSASRDGRWPEKFAVYKLPQELWT
jgi:hypothetical protein